MSVNPEPSHIPVLLEEAIGMLSCRPGGRYVDGTLGGGGYTERILKCSAPDGRVLGMDWDASAIERAASRLAAYGERVCLVHASYADLPRVLGEIGWKKVDGMVLDLGVSSVQLDEPDRGFSLMRDGPLDMRMDRSACRTAADLVNHWAEKDLADVIYGLGEERWARRIARAIVAHRALTPFRTTMELAELIKRVVPHSADSRRIHPATRTFQALRLAVNLELESLEKFLSFALDLLEENGRLSIVSFHSLEDRLVKRAFKAWAARCQCPPQELRCTCSRQQRARLLTRKVVTPTEQEIELNPRARSAKLRAVQKCAQAQEGELNARAEKDVTP